MEIALLVVVLIVTSLNFWYLTKLVDEVRHSRNQLIRMVGTTQSKVKYQRRSDPYPKIPHPKVGQRYEGQGAKRSGSEGAVTASNTPVRIGSVKRRRVGGTPRDPESS